jgi:selenocysteine lyase/cysteine desulfurase
LGERLLAGFRQVQGLSLFGPPGMDGRVPTFSFTLKAIIRMRSPRILPSATSSPGQGSFYAVEPLEQLGLMPSGGLVRVGLCHYSTAQEVDRLIDALTALAEPGTRALASGLHGSRSNRHDGKQRYGGAGAPS